MQRLVSALPCGSGTCGREMRAPVSVNSRGWCPINRLAKAMYLDAVNTVLQKYAAAINLVAADAAEQARG